MTALTQYERLESSGLWRAGPREQRREVTVSFGKATLVIADGAGRPLSHWSLPAIHRQNPGQMPALFAPDTDATETLELDDDLMIDAIGRVQASLARHEPHPGRLRWLGGLAILSGLAAAAIFWLPGALRGQTLAVVPPSKRAEIGATVLGHMQAQTGPACRTTRGRAALAALRDRILPDASGGQIVVLPDALEGAVALPGNLIVLGAEALTVADDPAVVAGYVLQATAAPGDPLAPLLDSGGLRATVTLLTTGDLPPAALEDYAADLLAGMRPLPTRAEMRQAFVRADVPVGPYATATGQADLAPVEAADGQREVLSDADWVGLRGICDS